LISITETHKMDDSGKSPVYVILGATGGIGKELCHQLASKGAQLIIGARSDDKLNELASQINAYPYPLDATQMDQVDQCVKKAVEIYGRIEGVANCVGSILLKPAHRMKEGEWELVINANLTSAFATVKAAAGVMRKTGGSVVLISSAAARVGIANHEAIAAAKAGVIGLTLSAAATYARYNIRFNCVAPGLVRTPLSAPIISSEMALKASTSMHALGRLGEPSDVASAIVWLLSPEQSWVTGQVLGVDGGLSNLRPQVG
jgi:NAD(P)-dependent dehydrogenase (short-subunit alcohol dehydrogenase family)